MGTAAAHLWSSVLVLVLATAALVLALTAAALVAHENDHDADEDGDEVDEQLHGVPDRVAIAATRLLHDHLRIEQYVCAEDHKAEVELRGGGEHAAEARHEEAEQAQQAHEGEDAAKHAAQEEVLPALGEERRSGERREDSGGHEARGNDDRGVDVDGVLDERTDAAALRWGEEGEAGRGGGKEGETARARGCEPRAREP